MKKPLGMALASTARRLGPELSVLVLVGGGAFAYLFLRRELRTLRAMIADVQERREADLRSNQARNERRASSGHTQYEIKKQMLALQSRVDNLVAQTERLERCRTPIGQRPGVKRGQSQEAIRTSLDHAGSNHVSDMIFAPTQLEVISKAPNLVLLTDMGGAENDTGDICSLYFLRGMEGLGLVHAVGVAVCGTCQHGVAEKAAVARQLVAELKFAHGCHVGCGDVYTAVGAAPGEGGAGGLLSVCEVLRRACCDPKAADYSVVLVATCPLTELARFLKARGRRAAGAQPPRVAAAWPPS